MNTHISTPQQFIDLQRPASFSFRLAICTQLLCGEESQTRICFGLEPMSDCSRVLRVPIREKRRRSWMVPQRKDGRSLPRCCLQHTCWCHQCSFQIYVCLHPLSLSLSSFISDLFWCYIQLMMNEMIAGTDTTSSCLKEGRIDRLHICYALLLWKSLASCLL